MKKILFLLTLVLLSGCYKDEDNFIPDSRPPENFVKTSFTGIVTNEAGFPIAGARIKAGNKTLSTDVNGVFIINNIEVNTRKAHIQVAADSYFSTSRTLSVTSNISQNIVFKLTPKQEIGTFAATAGGTFSLPDGTVFDFPLGPVAGDYDGGISVNGKVFPIQNSSTSRTTPGDLFGINTDDKEQLLMTYGMLMVEMVSENGQPLDLSTDKSITVELPVSGDLNPPATIPIWYFDELDGLWHEAGVATLEGSFYRATLDRPGYWNFAKPFPLMEISGKVIKESEPIGDILIGIRFEETGTIRLTYTNSEGFYHIKAPANQEITVGIYDENCQRFANSITRTTTTTDLTFDDLSGAEEVISYGGQVMNCNADPVINGYVIVGNEIVKNINSTGSYNGSFTAGCSNLIAFKAYDRATQENSGIRNVANNPSLNVSLRACPLMGEQINMVYDGNNFSLQTNPEVTLNPTGSNEDGSLIFEDNNGSFTIGFIGDLAGVYEVNMLTMNDLANENEYVASDLNMSVTLDQSVSAGEELTGSFEGFFTDTDGADHSISGEFLVIRDN